MVVTGRLTGEYDSTGYIGVRLSHGEELFARPMTQAPIIATYTKEWVDTYGDNFIAIVTFENDQKERPLLLGVVPLKNPEFPEEGYENNYFFTTKKFRIWVNDDANEVVIDALQDGKMKWGNKDVTEPAVLGNIAAQLLNEFITDLGNVGTIVTSSGVTSKISTSPQWGTLVSKWNTKWNNFKSGKVFLK